MTSQDDIRQWLQRGKADDATHMIVMCDTFNWEDYPVYVKPEERAEEVLSTLGKKPMQKVMEVYNLADPLEPQLHEPRAWHL